MDSNGDGHDDVELESIPSLAVYVPVLREVLGEIIAREQHHWEQTRKQMEAEIRAIGSEAQAIIAELRASLAELGDRFARRIDEQIARRALRGPPGEPGAPGEKGEPGPAGRLPVARIWKEGIAYEGDVVLYDGSTWQAKRDTASTPGSDDWALLAAAGRDAVTPRVRGTWKPDGKYRALDICAHNGGSFIARHDDPGPLPGGGWQCMSMPGKKGAEGPRGERGPSGITGREGTGIADVFVDAEHYMLRIPFTDGKVGEINLRPMFEQFVLESRGA